MDHKDHHFNKTLSKGISSKELHPGIIPNTVRMSKSDEAVTANAASIPVPVSKHNSIKSEKDVRFAVSPIDIPDRPSEKDRLSRESRLSRSSESSKDLFDRQDSKNAIGSPKVPRKYFTNWKQACDKTKDRTKELLKRWRTLPEHEIGPEDGEHSTDSQESKSSKGHGWSVHVWTTWVNRYSIDGGEGGEGDEDDEDRPEALSPLQVDKMTLFFTELLDLDRDDYISEQDFEHFCERLAHFADWSTTSSEFHILLEVKSDFIENFIGPLPQQYREKSYWRRLASGLPHGNIDCAMWLARWPLLLPPCSRFHRLPLFLQYFCKVLFGIINKSGSGEISRQEYKAFYMSVVGLTSARCDEIMETAFKLFTSNGHLRLNFETFKRCYANWLCGRNSNGPGQWLIVPPKGPLSIEPFPVDYSALNTDPARLEKYIPNNKTNRHSVIV